LGARLLIRLYSHVNNIVKAAAIKKPRTDNYS
jgi:hypothetical protein